MNGLDPDSTSAEEQQTAPVESANEEQPNEREEVSLDMLVGGFGEEEEDSAPQNVEQPETDSAPVVEPTPQKITIEGQEIDLEELKSGYLRQSDYTKKTQELANTKTALQPFEVLNNYLAQNPDDFKRVVDLIKEGQQPKVEPVPDDPIEALKHEAVQEAVEKTTGQIDSVNQQVLEMQKQQQINNVLSSVQRDPLYTETHAKIDSYVRNDYAKIHGVEAAQTLFQTLDSNPEAYMNLYKTFRTEKKAEPPVKKDTAAPVLTTSDQAIPDQKGMQKKVKAAELKQSYQKARGGKIEDVVDYLDKSGLIDHLS